MASKATTKKTGKSHGKAGKASPKLAVKSKKASPAKASRSKVKAAAPPRRISEKSIARATAKPVAKSEPPSGKPALRGDSSSVRAPSKAFAGAVAALEAGIKLMYAEEFEKAIKTLNKVIADYPDEPEIQASAKARVQACEKKLNERARAVLRSPDDHYNLGIAFLNRGDLDSALNHFQQALKLSPRADHILYAIAAANALQGNKDQAITYLKQSIHHRPENRFQAVQDHDFAGLIEEPAFKELITGAEK